MNIEEIREYFLAKPGVTEGFPFGQDVLVFSDEQDVRPHGPGEGSA